MDAFAGALDVLKALLSLGLLFFAFSLYRIFRGGMMERGFTLLAVAPLFFFISEVSNAIKNFGYPFFQEKLVADSFEVAFLATLFAGFYFVASAWRTTTHR
ncbi:MAG: hypothetical protein KGI38_03525 [Thaumarchaeota archaeon]|nr:hypothetical protein [Nitrososphaerota archaeon]